MKVSGHEPLCRICASRLIKGWKGWPGSDAVPKIPKMDRGICPVCGGREPLDPNYIFYRNYHSRYSTGLPDYFELIICRPDGLLNQFLSKWGSPYGDSAPVEHRIAIPKRPQTITEAAWEGDFPTIRQLVEGATLVDQTDIDHGLRYACRKGLNDIAVYLVEHGADINKADTDGRTPLYESLAATRYDINVVNMLVMRGACVNCTTETGWIPLMSAAMWGRSDAARLLLAAGANPNLINKECKSALDLAVERLNRHEIYSEIVSLLLPKMDKAQALFNSTINHKTKTLMILRDVNVNLQEESGKTALMIAAERGFNDIILILLNRNADTELRDNDGQTALTHAVRGGWYKSARLLLRRGAKVVGNSIQGQDLLTYASQNGSGHMFRLLKNRGRSC